MATKKNRLTLHLTNKQMDNILSTFAVYDLVERYLADPRVHKVYDHLHDLFHAQFPDTMATVSEHMKPEFYENFDEYIDSLRSYFKHALAEFVLEEFTSTAGNIDLTTKRVRNKAPMFFTQRFHIVYEEMSFNINLDKVLNGQQTVDWL